MIGYSYTPVLKAGHPGVPSYYVCLSGLWLGGLHVLYLSFLSYLFKLVCYAHVFPCMLPHLSPSPDLYRVKSVYNKNIKKVLILLTLYQAWTIICIL